MAATSRFAARHRIRLTGRLLPTFSWRWVARFELSRILYTLGMRTVPFTEARAKLSDLLDEVGARHEHVLITRNGLPAAVLVPPEEQEILEETLEILQDEELLAALRESEDDVAHGRLTTLRDIRRELGLD
jgi:antitoxin YefM